MTWGLIAPPNPPTSLKLDLFLRCIFQSLHRWSNRFFLLGGRPVPDFDVDATIIGGGVIGLAILHKLSRNKLNSVLLERHHAFGQETSSRNSEVAHGGMYYTPNSLKATLSVTGRRQLYQFAHDHNIPHRQTGKLIVATHENEVPGLKAILETGKQNDVENLRLISGKEAAAIAPGIHAVAAIYSPATGVINAHALMDALLRQAETDGGTAVRGSPVLDLEPIPNGWTVHYRDAEGNGSITCHAVVNAAGLGAQHVMAMAGIDPIAADLRLHPCKGNYCSVAGESRKRIAHLVYPAPEANLAGLGIHTVIDISGGVKIGPDVHYVDEADEYDYSVDEALPEMFFRSVSRYLPCIRPEDITPDMAGIRPKLSAPGQPARDFHIAHEADRGFPGFINLAGMESPGLTACLAVGDMVADMVKEITGQV